MKDTAIAFGLLILCLILLFRISKFSFLRGDISVEVLIGLFSISFFILGLIINRKRKKELAAGIIDFEKIQQLKISDREYEVLQHIATGSSNKEIADSLFVSESTIKTHVSNLLIKLDAKRRTQAVKKAKDLRLID